MKNWVSRTAAGKLHLPPERLRDVGGSDFEETGREFVHHFVQIAGLQATERVLEIGCGIGRIALPLIEHLNGGEYTGMDVVATSIQWCQRHITKKHPNFRFFHADLYNARYNPNGTSRDESYVFPLPSGSFDLIYLTSVFTHMLPDGLCNYLGQIRRMLAPDGRVFMTLFLLNPTQEKLASQGANAIDFRFKSGPYRTRDDAVPESAVAYEEEYVLNLLREEGLELEPPIRYGTWAGRRVGLSFQDILLATLSRR